MKRSILIAILAMLAARGPLCGAGLDDLLGGDGDDIGVLLGDKPVSQEEFETRLTKALRQNDDAVRRKELAELLGIFVRTRSIVPAPRDWNAFSGALLETADPARLVDAAVKLLTATENLQFDLAARSRVNLGIRFANAVNGVPFEQLQTLHDRFKGSDLLDLEWLLPALGRAGGAAALPLINSYRADRTVIPLGHESNIRRVPCAAALAAAYAGESNALEQVLGWYETDVVNLPKHAFNIAWAIQEGMKPNYAILDYATHRIAQAERLLDFKGPEHLPALIARANRDASISLTAYVIAKMDTADASGLPRLLALADHPCVLVKQRALLAFFERGDKALRQEAVARTRALLDAPSGADRFMAAETLQLLGVEDASRMIEQRLAQETSPTVRRRLETLRLGGTW